MTERSSYRYSRLAFFNEASIKKLKQLCGREFTQAQRAAQQQNRKWSAEAKDRLKKATEADEFADMMLNPNREFEWDFYERLGLFRDFLKTLRTSPLYDNYEKAFLSEIYSSIPEGDLNEKLSYDQVLPYTQTEPSTTTSGKDLMERKAIQSIRKKEWPFFCMNSGIAGNPRLPNGWSDIKTRTFRSKRMPS